VPILFLKRFRRLLLPLPDFAVIDHDIVLVLRAIDPNPPERKILNVHHPILAKTIRRRLRRFSRLRAEDAKDASPNET
jgi:hypothetical protein